MGESSGQIEGPQPKPSRFQFVPVPGEFTRGRWKCRDSYHPYAETLEFEKNKTKEEANPEKISVFFKLRTCEEEAKESSTIQVTSVENNILELADENSSTENIIITRKNGVTIVRKTSGTLVADGYDKIRDLSIDDFEHKPVKPPQVPPTPMNTPPATMTEASNGDSLAPKNSQNVFQSANDEAFAHSSRKVSVTSDLASLPENALPTSKQDLQTTSAVIFEKQIQPEIASHSEPTFQVIQTEESKNMSMDSVKNVIDIQPEEPKMENRVGETASEVMITVSAVLEKKEIERDAAVSINNLEAGIPITSQPTAPHSTPYGTPKDTQRSPTFDEAFQASSPVSAPVNPPAVESSLPIDNKIEQAMELVKTHLTYAVREEVDTLRNTITDLEYQMREYQFECNYYRQNCSQEVVDQAANFVRQQMAKFQQPARRSVSTVAVTVDGVPQSSAQASTSSPHMRNLQTQIQQMKQTAPGAVSKPVNASDELSTGAQPL